MPQPTFHLLLATEALDRMAAGAPFDCSDADNRNAFLHGAIGPDMGFFPGGTRLISDLAHAQGTGDLIRAIIHGANTPRLVAFAHGWATHILTDSLFHPLINSTAAELEGLPIENSRVQSMHIRMEIGLDLLAHRMRPDLQRIRLHAFIDSNSARRLSHAFANVHDIEFLPNMIVSTHRRVTQFLGPLMAIQSAMLIADRNRTGPAWSPIVSGTRLGFNALGLVARSMGGDNSEAVAFLRPQMPAAEFMSTVEQLSATFFQAYERDARAGLLSFPNYDVHRGGVAEPAFNSYKAELCV